MKKVLSLCLAALAAGGPSVYARSVVYAPAVVTSDEGGAPATQSEKNLPKAPPGGATARQGSNKDVVRGREHQRAAAAAFELGVKFGRAGRFKEAVGAFEEAVLYNPDHVDAHFNLGHAHYDLGRWADAVVALRRAADLDPKDVETFNYLGAAYFRQGLYDEAIEAYKKAILLKPRLGGVRYNIANAFYRLRRYEPALLYYREASYFEPKSAELFNDMGVAYAEWGRYVEAVEYFKRALGQNSDDAYAQNNLALAYYFQGQHQEAAKAFERATRLAPRDEVIGRNAELAFGRSNQSRVALGDRVSLSAAAAADARDMRWMGRSDVIRGVAESDPPARAEANKEAAALPSTAVNRAPAPQPTPAPPETAAAPPPQPTPSTDASEPPPDAATETAASPSAPSAGAPAELMSVYRVGVGDVLDIRLRDDRSKNSTLYTVLAGGLVEYAPLGDPFEAAGKTTDEIAAYIKSELQRRAVHDDPQVIVSVRDYASHTVLVSGLVGEPGAKLLRREAVPLYVVIADAQPLPEAGRVLVTSDAGARRTEVALDDHAAVSMLIRAGDVINVLARQQQFYFIGGKVEAAGQKEFHAGITLTQAILAAGGSLHESRTALLTRQTADGNLSTSKLSLKEIMTGRVPDPPLQPGDRVEVIR